MLARSHSHWRFSLRSITSFAAALNTTVFDNEHYASLLKSCSETKDLSRGKQVHSQLTKLQIDTDTFLGNLLINMYGRCGCVAEARQAFHRIKQLNVFSWNIMIAAYAQAGHIAEARQMFEAAAARNAVTWNTLMTGYAQAGHSAETLDLFDALLTSGMRPTVVTFLAALDACSAPEFLEAGRIVHSKIKRQGLEWDPKIATALVSMYGRCGSLEMAAALLEEIVDKKVAMVAVIGATNAMVTAYAQSGHMEHAKRAFDEMRERTVVSWNAMVAAYAQNGHAADALASFRAMLLHGLRPNHITFASILEACSTLRETRLLHSMILALRLERNIQIAAALTSSYGRGGDPDSARRIFDAAAKNSGDVVLWTSMIAAYAQSGRMEAAREIFDAAPERNVVSWTAMISGLAQAGLQAEAMAAFARMDLDGVPPNSVTLLCVLDACASLAILDRGELVLREMDGSGAAELGGDVLLNLYAKSGCVGGARAAFAKLRHRSTASWTAMITAVAQHGRWRDAAALLAEMALSGAVAPNEITFVSVLAASGHAGEVDAAARFFAVMVADFGVAAMGDHYLCVADALGRAGRISAAEELLRAMPFEAGDVARASLMAACAVHGDAATAARLAAEIRHASESAPYVLLSNLFFRHGGRDSGVAAGMRAAAV